MESQFRLHLAKCCAVVYVTCENDSMIIRTVIINSRKYVRAQFLVPNWNDNAPQWAQLIANLRKLRCETHDHQPITCSATTTARTKGTRTEKRDLYAAKGRTIPRRSLCKAHSSPHFQGPVF